MCDKTLTLMCVHAHPDDEAIGTGGILSRYSEEGLRTVLVVATMGELGELNGKIITEEDERAKLAELRRKELERSCQILGIQEVYFLNYRDSGMAGTEANTHPCCFAHATLEEAGSRLARIIRLEKPDIITCYNERGIYGHPDHIQVNLVTTYAFDRVGEAGFFSGLGMPPWRPKKLYYQAIPLSRFKMLARVMEERGENFKYDPDFLGTSEEKITTKVDVRRYLDRKRAALRSHQSQVGPDSFFMHYPQDIQEEILGYEYFVCVRNSIGPLPGSMTESSLFQGLL